MPWWHAFKKRGILASEGACLLLQLQLFVQVLAGVAWMGEKGQRKFTDVWANQTNLGQRFGLSAIAMGKKRKRAEFAGRGWESNRTGSLPGLVYTNAAQGWHPVLVEFTYRDRDERPMCTCRQAAANWLESCAVLG